jgi:rhamnogalacturonan endolyase
MYRLMLVVLAFASACIALAQPLVFEAEKVSGPAEAWQTDKFTETKWNLWSTDNDAAKKWSGGVVLQSPLVMADREQPEDGAPVLHTVLTGIPKGTYVIDIKFGRDLGVSLDGTTWQRASALGGRLGKFDIDGQFEWWVDDRYAVKEGAGSSYYDTITLTATQPEVMGVSNGGFEFGKDLGDSGWGFWSRDNAGSAELVGEGRTGRGLKLVHTGERDFALTNAGRLKVKPGEVYLATAWLKCQDTDSADLSVVAMGGGKTLTWSLASDGVWATTAWKKVEAKAIIPPGCDEIYLRITGVGKATVWVDDVAIVKLNETAPVAKPKTKVTGYAKVRVEEKLDRGLVAMAIEGGKVYVGWRLLKSDAANVAFNVYRGTGRMLPVKLTDKPLTQTTDFVDEKPPLDKDNMWFVKAVVGGKEQPASDTACLGPNPEAKPYMTIKLQGDYTFQKVGLGDLNGDGKLDYVIKQPLDNIDPAGSYWEKSPETYKLEAYLNDGTFLWRTDMGWGIERGIWYSPYVVWDFDGDGKAEVAAKTSEGDPRAADGRVHSGPEYCSILDGMTGKVKARVAWPARKDFGGGLGGYNYASRNQLGVAYLDGKTPCLIVARGTYTIMLAIAYQFRNGKLTELWKWDNREESDGRNWRGQGAHWMHSGDVDGDGRDEVVLGSCVVDDDGKGLWTTGLGHPDRCFLTDIDPARPGLEIFYHLEPRQKVNGLCVVDAKTGEIIWGLQEQTWHVGSGNAADIDPFHPGQEVWAVEDGKGDPKGENYKGNPPKFLLTAQGAILARDEKVPSVETLYWDADGLKELVGGGRAYKYQGQPVFQGFEGSHVFWGDIIGDWREELITSVKGELRIYTTTIPASDRHVCLLQDPIYRIDVAHLAMGYGQNPMLGYYLKQQSPALWMSPSANSLFVGEPVTVTATLVAPGDKAVSGKLTLSPEATMSVTPTEIALSAGAGQTAQGTFTVTLKDAPALLYGGKSVGVNAAFTGTAHVSSVLALKVDEKPLSGVPMAQAEAFGEQSGGAVQIREDKMGAVGKAISHWDTQGHTLQWQIAVPQAGKYWLVLRYCTPTTAQRETTVDGLAPLKQGFGGTGGFGSATVSDWAHQAVRGSDGNRVMFDLTAGEHTVKMVNADGRGMNLDYLAFVPVK